MSESWAEHESCARCGSALGEEYNTNHLGVRFCCGCYTEVIEERERQRLPEPGLEEICNRCHGSLINGYRANYMGVHFCVSCFDRTHSDDGRPRSDWAERDRLSVAQHRRDSEEDREGGWRPGEEDEEGVYLHDVFFVTTILALVMYAMARFGGALLALGGY